MSRNSIIFTFFSPTSLHQQGSRSGRDWGGGALGGGAAGGGGGGPGGGGL